jgi:hypothetical protein
MFRKHQRVAEYSVGNSQYNEPSFEATKKGLAKSKRYLDMENIKILV